MSVASRQAVRATLPPAATRLSALMTSNAELHPPFHIRRLEPDDASSLVRCFERCYGKTYPNGDFYDAQQLRDRIETGTLRSVVAIDSTGEVVGHTGLTVRQPAPTEIAREAQLRQARAAIAGNTVVDPDFRGRGVLRNLGTALQELTLSDGFVGYVHYPTTAHTIMQRRSVERNGVETGLLLAYIPDTTNYGELAEPDEEGRGRLAVTVVYQPFTRAPLRKVYLPDCYAERVQAMYREVNLKRLRLPKNDRELPTTSNLLLDMDRRRDLLRMQIETIGVDLGEQIDTLLETYPSSDSAPAIVHVDLALDDPGTEIAVETLQARGFFYGGLLPELAHTDVLRMQRLHALPPGPDPFAVLLSNPGAQRLLIQLREEAPKRL